MLPTPAHMLVAGLRIVGPERVGLVALRQRPRRIDRRAHVEGLGLHARLGARLVALIVDVVPAATTTIAGVVVIEWPRAKHALLRATSGKTARIGLRSRCAG